MIPNIYSAYLKSLTDTLTVDHAEALSFTIAAVYSPDDQRQIMEFLRLPLPTPKTCLGCGSATQPCCGH